MSKKILSCVMTLALLFTAMGSFIAKPAITASAATATDKQYATSGLVARYDGTLNQRNGHSLSATTWQDLSGNGYDIDMSGKSKSYFTNYAFVLDSESFAMNDALLNVINSNAFTVEIALGDIESYSQTFVTFINSLGNDNFSFFIRNASNVLELKTTSNNRPVTAVPEAIEFSTYHTIAVTFTAGGTAYIYVDGTEVASSTVASACGAVGPLALGSSAENKAHKAEYRGVRIYNRALSASELQKNSSYDKLSFITETSKAIPLTVNVPYPTSNIFFFADDISYTPGENCIFTTSSSNLTISNGYITAKATGIYDLTIYNGEKAVDIKAVVKNPSERDHVIFTDDFNGSSLGSGYRVLGPGSISFNGTHMVVNSTGQKNTRIFLPSVVDHFGDYNILMNAIFQQVDNNARWMAIMFRGSSTAAYPYYQMCVRQAATATNGVEFSKRLEDDSTWTVLNTASNSFDASLGSNVQLRAKVVGSNVREYVATKKVLETNAATDLRTGAVGISVDRATVAVDNITVILIAGKAPKAAYINVAQPDTGIIGGINLTERLESTSQLNTLASRSVKPANVIIYTDSTMKVYNSTYTTSFSTLNEVMNVLMRANILPTFYVKDNAAVDAVSSFLSSMSCTDAFFMSPTDSVLSYARSRYYLVRRALDLTNEYKNYGILSAEILNDVRSRAHTAWASTVVLPSNCVSNDVAEYLQNMVVTLWINEVNPLTNKTDAFRLLTRGSYGIISDNATLIYETQQTHMGSNVLTRSPLAVGHRGHPGSGIPDNTLEGCVSAVNNGAEVLELDIYLTSDNYIVCSHDLTTGNYYNENLNVESNTLARLQQMRTKGSYSLVMPTLESIFNQFKNTGIRYFVEIKSTRPEIVGALKALTEKVGNYNQVSVITFERTGQLERLRSEWPNMSVGCLINSNTVPVGSTSEQTVENVASKVQSYGSTFNPGNESITEDYIRASNIRGVMINPWTLNTQALQDKFLMYGAASLTTDYVDWMAHYIKRIAVTQTSYSIDFGQTHQVSGIVGVKYGSAEDISTIGTVFIIEGADIVTVGANNTMTFSKPGKVTYSIAYGQVTNTGSSYAMFSEPITVEIRGSLTEGDVNGDDIINAKDVIQYKLYLAGRASIEEYVADMNGDGLLNSTDVKLLAELVGQQ